MQKLDAQKVKLQVIQQLIDICETLRVQNGDADISLAEASEQLNQLAVMMVDPVGASAGPSAASIKCPHCHKRVTVTLKK